MHKKFFITISIFLFIIIASSFYFYINSLKQEKLNDLSNKNANTIANPASSYCLSHGGRNEIRKNEDDSEYGVCVFQNGVSCDEWEFYRGNCDQNMKKLDIGEEMKNIKKAILDKKSIDFSDFDIVVTKNIDRFIMGTLSPKGQDAKAYYFYGVKDGDLWKILSVGDGDVNCSWIDGYKNFPASMIPECINENGQKERRDLPL